MDISKFLSNVISMKWMMHPQIAVNYGAFLAGLIDGSILFEEEKPPLNAMVATPDKKIIKLYDNQEDENGNKSDSIFDNFPKGSILILPLKGVLFKEDTWWSWGTETVSNVLREAADHKNIKAAIIDTDSGGGSVDAIPPMIDQINYSREKMPVIGLADMAASAAYYSISATDMVIASNDISSEFGSIGVMMSWADLQPYWEKMGVKFHKVYAPESNYKNKAFENALKGNYELLKFQNDVRKFRAGKIDITQKGILNGRMFYARDAVKYGLADKLGNLDFAIEQAISMAGK